MRFAKFRLTSAEDNELNAFSLFHNISRMRLMEIAETLKMSKVHVENIDQGNLLEFTINKSNQKSSWLLITISMISALNTQLWFLSFMQNNFCVDMVPN